MGHFGWPPGSCVSSHWLEPYLVKPPTATGSLPTRMALPSALSWPSSRICGFKLTLAGMVRGNWAGSVTLAGISASMAFWSAALAATQARVSFLPARLAVGAVKLRMAPSPQAALRWSGWMLYLNLALRRSGTSLNCWLLVLAPIQI